MLGFSLVRPNDQNASSRQVTIDRIALLRRYLSVLVWLPPTLLFHQAPDKTEWFREAPKMPKAPGIPKKLCNDDVTRFKHNAEIAKLQENCPIFTQIPDVCVIHVKDHQKINPICCQSGDMCST